MLPQLVPVAFAAEHTHLAVILLWVVVLETLEWAVLQLRALMFSVVSLVEGSVEARLMWPAAVAVPVVPWVSEVIGCSSHPEPYFHWRL